MIQVENIIDKDKSLMTIIFNSDVIKHLNAKCDDNINIFQSKFNLRLFTLFKADTGYRITRVPNKKKTYRILIRHPFIGYPEHECIECTFFLKKNGLIKLSVK